MKGRFASKAMMEKPGMTVSRWIDGVLEKNELIDQDSNLRAIVYWGHAPNSQTRGLEMKQAMEKVDLMVIVDPYPTAASADARPQGRRVPAAGGHAVRDVGHRARRRTARCSGARR